jgi:hypothetical protein
MSLNTLYYMVAILFALLAALLPTDHCSDCPGVECLCIQDVDGNWMLSPEVGE